MFLRFLTWVLRKLARLRSLYGGTDVAAEARLLLSLDARVMPKEERFFPPDQCSAFSPYPATLGADFSMRKALHLFSRHFEFIR